MRALGPGPGPPHAPALSRPPAAIGSDPFSCEIVLLRDESNGWQTQKPINRHFLYPLHVSLTFVHTPTLQAALYWLLLRYLHRSYEDVAQVARRVSRSGSRAPRIDALHVRCIFVACGRAIASRPKGAQGLHGPAMPAPPPSPGHTLAR